MIDVNHAVPSVVHSRHHGGPDWIVMAGFGPAIHDFTDRAKDVDGRPKGGHDEMLQPASIASSIRRCSTGQPWL
jgi:hypothetical protein